MENPLYAENEADLHAFIKDEQEEYEVEAQVESQYLIRIRSARAI